RKKQTCAGQRRRTTNQEHCKQQKDNLGTFQNKLRFCPMKYRTFSGSPCRQTPGTSSESSVKRCWAPERQKNTAMESNTAWHITRIASTARSGRNLDCA